MGEKGIKLGSFFDLSGFKPVSVGKRIREIRKEKRITIKDLAKRSGLSVNTISLVENEKSSPSVNTLEQIAQVLEIPLTWLFEPIDDFRRVIHTQAGNRQELSIDGIRVEDCGQVLRNQPFQPFIVTLPPGRDSGNDLITHSGHEFVYCISGELDYFIDEVDYKLQADDSLFFESDIPHRWKNMGNLPAVYLEIIAPGEKREVPGEEHIRAIIE